MDFKNLIMGGAFLGVLASCWEQIKAVGWRFVGLLIRRIEIPSEAAHQALIAYLVTHYKVYKNYDRLYGADFEHMRDGRYGLVSYEQFGNRSLMFWNGWFPFLFNNSQEKKTKSNQQENNSGGPTKIFSTITFLRGTLDFEKLLRSACDESNRLTWEVNNAEEQAKNRFVIHHFPTREENHDDWDTGSNGLPWFRQRYYRLLAHTPEQLGKAPTHDGSAIGNLIFPKRVTDLIREIELWRNNRDWYRSKGIPWKRGWMLYGPPGTGKTALARAFAEDLNMPIYVFNLAQMGNAELTKAWTEMQVNVPCIALIEDIDNVFHGRENVSRKNSPMPFFMQQKKDDDSGNSRPMSFSPLTFDTLLNCLDGVERSDGIFTIITTNDISKIDPAMGQPRKLPDGTQEFISTRPGRIDKAVELTYMENEDKKRMAARILGEYEQAHLEMLAFIERYPDLLETPAQFQERCGQVALACFWKQKHGDELLLLDREREDNRNGWHESAVSGS
ncbi:MAG: AAA family ATPase [Planctomycetia bacterium]|nr:AAA family ATPase [Planctomycetia bacterium]